MSKKNRNPQSEEALVENIETVEVVTEEPKAKRVKKSTRLTEEQICEKYPHAVAGKLMFETEGKHAGKQTIEADLACGHRARVATSDLFQVTRCAECKKPVKKERAPKAEKTAKAKIDPAQYNKPTFVPQVVLSDEELANLESVTA